MIRDRSLAVLRDGYQFGTKVRDGAAAATTRLLGRRAVVLGGSTEAVRQFYDEQLVRRRGAIPAPVKLALFGPGAVHGLDGAAHRARKAVFLELLTPAAAQEVAAIAERHWSEVDDTRVDLFDEAARVHTESICDWAGVPREHRYPRLAADLVALVDGFGSPSPRFARAASARLRTGRWAARLVRSVRAGEIAVKDDTVLGRLAGLDVRPEIAGVEVLNVLRPTVAVSWFVEFAAVELERQPQLRAALADDESLRESFAHELRRVYPFVPVLGARAQRAFEVCGQPVRPRDRVVLDVYGTLHDAALWPEPERFRAERFVDLEPDPFALIPQGGGRPDGHRCPGERLTIELIKVAASWLARVPLAVVPGDHSVPLTTMPTRPIDPVVLAEVRRTS